MKQVSLDNLWRIASRLLAGIFLLSTGIRAGHNLQAQADAPVNAPLNGPIMAFVTAAQDRIILQELTTHSTPNPSGSVRRELNFGAGLHNVWGFSPDGCQILATRMGGNGLAELIVANLDGSHIISPVLYDELPVSQWGIWEPQWSPDGSRIAFTMLRDGYQGTSERQYHIGWVDANGGAAQFYSQTGREHTPQWSPDGQWLAYVSYDERVAGADLTSTAEPTREPAAGQSAEVVTLLDEADLWMVSANAETKYRLTNFPTGSVSMPRWSPDGDLLSFVYSPGPNNDTQWIISRERGAQPTQLTFNWNLAMDLTWLPDSTGVLAVLRDFQGVKDNQLWRLPLTGNGDTDGTLYVSDPAFTFADYPRFSLDGSLLAFRSDYGLVVLNTGDQQVVLQDDTDAGNTPVVWSPAGFSGETGCKYGS